LPKHSGSSSNSAADALACNPNLKVTRRHFSSDRNESTREHDHPLQLGTVYGLIDRVLQLCRVELCRRT
jgi:hypothetical protein